MRVCALACVLAFGCAGDGSDDVGDGSSSSSSSSSTSTSSTTTSTTSTSTTTGDASSSEDEGSSEASTGEPGCGDTTGGDGYAALVEPILAANCSCHRAGSPAGLSLACGEGYDDLVEVASSEAAPLARVIPGNLAQSYLWLKLTNQHLGAGGSGARMPLNELPLSRDDLATIRAWIEAGAPP